MPHEVMLVELVQSVLTALVMIVLGYPLVRVFARRLERRGTDPAHLQEISHRLEQLETIAEATAVEVERISEGQRFVSKLLADPAKIPAARQGNSSEPGAKIR